MKLSTAMVLGSTLLKRGNYMTNRDDVGCVLQMADVAIGEAREITACSASARYWPWLSTWIPCPECGARRPANQVIATHLNDMHGWSTERIADFVRSIEPPEAETASQEEICEQTVSVNAAVAA